jgi:hypothetical protein
MGRVAQALLAAVGLLTPAPLRLHLRRQVVDASASRRDRGRWLAGGDRARRSPAAARCITRHRTPEHDRDRDRDRRSGRRPARRPWPSGYAGWCPTLPSCTPTSSPGTWPTSTGPPCSSRTFCNPCTGARRWTSALMPGHPRPARIDHHPRGRRLHLGRGDWHRPRRACTVVGRLGVDTGRPR